MYLRNSLVKILNTVVWNPESEPNIFKEVKKYDAIYETVVSIELKK